MKFKELPKLWRSVIIIEIVIVLLLTFVFIGVQVYMRNMRAENSAKRAEVKKEDKDLIGSRFEIPREGKDSVELNLYFPEQHSDKALPVIFNIHGGGFVFGDADEMDTQCDHWANDWNAVIVSVNYTKLDVKPISYGVEEVTDSIKYFIEHSSEYNVDTDHFFVIGHSAGGYYATKAAMELEKQDFKLAGQILVCPWTSGLPEQVSSHLVPALFILGGADPISQQTPKYQEVLKNACVPVTVKEYEGGLHPFISTPYPELSAHWSKEETEEFVTDKQKKLAVQAKNDIKEWIAEQIQ